MVSALFGCTTENETPTQATALGSNLVNPRMLVNQIPQGPRRSIFVQYRRNAPVDRLSQLDLGSVRFANDLGADNRWIAMEVSAHAFEALAGRIAALPWVEAVQIGRDDARITAFPVASDGFFPAGVSRRNQILPWGVEATDAPYAHLITGDKGAGAKVAILDTGVNCTHPDLAGHAFSGFDFIFMQAGSACSETWPHGTLVAGIVAASDDEFGVLGIAPDAEIYSVRVCNSNFGEPPVSCTDAAIASGISWAKNNGMDVINLSLADCGGDPSPVIRSAIQQAVDAGVIVVASAGNGSEGASSLFGLLTSGCPSTSPPSSYGNVPGVIIVGAYFIGDTVGVDYQFGSRIDLAAPSNVLTDSGLASLANFGFTSAATPHVSGAAALLLSAGVAPSQVKGRLTASARDLGAPGKDDFFGFGALDVLAAVIPGPKISQITWCTEGVIFGDCQVTAHHTSGLPPFQWRFEVSYSNGVNPPFDTGWGSDSTFVVDVPSGNYSIEVKTTVREHPILSLRHRTLFPFTQYLAVCTGGGGDLNAICPEVF